MKRTQAVAGIAALTLLAACAPMAGEAPGAADPMATSESSAIDIDACARQNLTTLVSGTLTVATVKPLLTPWYVDEDPENGEGFESALVYALAAELGFSRLEVQWEIERDSVLPVLAPQDPRADLAIAQLPIQASVASPVAFSDPYLEINQALVVRADSALVDVDSARSLVDARLAAVGDDAATFTEEVLQPRGPVPALSASAAASALRAGRVDGVIVDLPDAGAVLDEGDDLVLAGQFAPGPAPTQLGLALAPGNPLVQCVNAALGELAGRGGLEALGREWLGGDVRLIPTA